MMTAPEDGAILAAATEESSVQHGDTEGHVSDARASLPVRTVLPVVVP